MDLPLKALFDAPTVAELSRYITERLPATQALPEQRLKMASPWRAKAAEIPRGRIMTRLPCRLPSGRCG